MCVWGAREKGNRVPPSVCVLYWSILREQLDLRCSSRGVTCVRIRSCFRCLILSERNNNGSSMEIIADAMFAFVYTF